MLKVIDLSAWLKVKEKNIFNNCVKTRFVIQVLKSMSERDASGMEHSELLCGLPFSRSDSLPLNHCDFDYFDFNISDSIISISSSENTLSDWLLLGKIWICFRPLISTHLRWSIGDFKWLQNIKNEGSKGFVLRLTFMTNRSWWHAHERRLLERSCAHTIVMHYFR